MKMTVFWGVAQCSLVEVYRRFIVLMIETASTSETSVNFYQTKGRNAPENNHLQDYSASTTRSLNVPCGTICNQNVYLHVNCNVAIIRKPEKS
jgi:hypothetical protein